ncbi:serine/threonine-protein kinase [Planctomycetes bacterium TBK1r]|uniref:Serine/threonine-protein kinase PknB n=1 Tax=Stieleria magnilauensis TaxID=2527963 RepID=A0ABX5XZP7_9BACT|nr:Serine/threonine-protein kinase PknB [Planctomycetes bacterium TBK1r]
MPQSNEHPTPEEWHQFLSGKLCSGRAKELEEHCNRCPACATFLEQQSDSVGSVSLVPWDDAGQTPGVQPGSTSRGEDSAIPDVVYCDPLPSFEAGTEFGHYRLESLIGEGGNGVVYRAVQQQPIRRTVAVKIAKQAASDANQPQRFLLEHQTLSELRHSGIPHVYDAGVTASGRAYFVMEYIDGQPLSDYLCDHHLPVPDCLVLMKLLCEAVQYAHRNGVIHRDLKPSNILLERDEASGMPVIDRPRVIDFGIAKNLTSDAPSLTNTNEMVGTLEYMSPEQLELNPHCDTRGDVYGLGLIFYELLAFRLPYSATELRQMPLAAAIRTVRDHDPLLPSQTLVQTSVSPTNREVNLRIRHLQGELDWITMKAIDRDPERRYQSAALFAEDIQRHLNGDLITAAPPSLRHKAGKWIRKHRGWFAASVSFVSLLLLSGTIIVWLLAATLEVNRELALRTYIGEVQIAEERLERGHTAEAIEILQRHRDDPALARLRGLESRLLWKKTHPDALLDQVKVFHDRIDDMAVSARNQVATLSRKYQTIKFYRADADKLHPIGTLDSAVLGKSDPRVRSHWEKHAGESDRRRVNAMTWGRNPQPLISCVAYTPDGNTLAIGTCSGMVLLWDVKRQTVTRVLDCQSDLVYRVAISEDQRWLATAGTAVRLFDLNKLTADDKPRLLLQAPQTSRVDFSSDGRYLVLADHERNLRIWRTQPETDELPQMPMTVRVAEHATIRDVRFSPDDAYVVYGMSNSTVVRRSWDGNRLGEPDQMTTTKNGVKSVRFASNGILASTCDGGLLQYLDLTDPERPQRAANLAGHSGPVGCLAYLTTHDRFLTGGYDGTLGLYHPRPPRQRFRPTTPITCLDVSSDGKCLVLGFRSGVIELRRTASAAIEKTLQESKASVSALFYSRDQNGVVAVCSDRRLRIWNVQTGQCDSIPLPAAPKGIVGDLPDGRFLVAFRDSTIGLFDASGRMIRRWRVNEKGFAGAAYYPEAKQIVTCENNWIRFWDLGGNPIRKIPVNQDVRAVVAHPTEDVLIGYGVIGCIVAINPATGATLREYRGHVGVVERVIVLQGGKRLLSIGSDFTSRFWDYESGLEVLMQDGESRHYRRYGTNERQDILVTVFSDDTVEIVNLESDGK